MYDVRDPSATNDGIMIIGGFVGELIITFTCLNDFILANPNYQNFQFTLDMLDQFLTELLISEESAFPDASIVLHLPASLEELTGSPEPAYDQVAKLVRDPSNLADFGLQFLFEVQKDIVLAQDVIDIVFRSLCKAALMKPRQPLPLPEMPDDADDDKRDELNEQTEKIKAENENIEKENAKIQRLK